MKRDGSEIQNDGGTLHVSPKKRLHQSNRTFSLVDEFQQQQQENVQEGSSKGKSHVHHTAPRSTAPGSSQATNQRRRGEVPLMLASASVPAGSALSEETVAAQAAARVAAIGPERRRLVGASSADPNFYKNACGYSAEHNKDLEEIYAAWDSIVPVGGDEEALVEDYCRGLVEKDCRTARDVERAMSDLRRRFKDRRSSVDGAPLPVPKKSTLANVYARLAAQGELPSPHPLQRLLVKKAAKSLSGVLVVTVLTSPYPTVYPEEEEEEEEEEHDGYGGGGGGGGGSAFTQRFSCEWDCHYCPNEPGQPRSYLHDEPSVLRANRNDFDAVRQFTDRAVTLAINGHPVDKIELLVLGGTWASYPAAYQEQFCRDLFYAANTFHDRPAQKRRKRSLAAEKAENETARVKIIGLTLETRPDCIDLEELRRMRRYGCTRVQLGMQHTDDGVLRKINRGATRADMVKAITLLKDCGYKLDLHLMPNLPGASAALDARMFHEVLTDEWLQADQWKIYPCEITPWTKIKEWFEVGAYVPYPDEQLVDLLLRVLPKIHPWVRVNRVVRDIPSQYILAGMDRPNLRQDLDKVMRGRGVRCQDIRAREVQGQQDLTGSAILMVRRYDGSGADEYFLSFETRDRATIFAFCRLRLGGAAGGLDYADEEGDDDGRGGALRRLRRRKSRRRKEAKERGELLEPTDGRASRAADDDDVPARTSDGHGDGHGDDVGSRGFRKKWLAWLGDAVRRALYGTRCRESAFAPALSLGFSGQTTATTAAAAAAAQGPARRRRMRRDPKLEPVFPELVGCALVRELHVYGQLESVQQGSGGDGDDDDDEAGRPPSFGASSPNRSGEQQHVGFGTQLMKEAERLSARAGYTRVAVIAGVGVRNYYRARLGYDLQVGAGEFMVKRLSLPYRLRHHRFLGGVSSLPLGLSARAVESLLRLLAALGWKTRRAAAASRCSSQSAATHLSGRGKGGKRRRKRNKGHPGESPKGVDAAHDARSGLEEAGGSSASTTGGALGKLRLVVVAVAVAVALLLAAATWVLPFLQSHGVFENKAASCQESRSMCINQLFL